MALKAPFPYFGGKSRVAPVIWEALGDVPNFIEPFLGSGAVLLARPHEPRTETVNDLDGLLTNAWRGIQFYPEETAYWADWPVIEGDLHARHKWLRGERASITARLEADPFWCDPMAAGWWMWGQSIWIGGGWCDMKERVPRSKPMLSGDGSGSGRGVKKNSLVVKREMPHLQAGGKGVQKNELIKDKKRERPSLDAGGKGVIGHRKLPKLDRGEGGVYERDNLLEPGYERKRPEMKRGGRGAARRMHLARGEGVCNLGNVSAGLLDYFAHLSARLRRVRVCTGDWHRICGPTPTTYVGLTGMFLDPPYGDTRDPDLYAADSMEIMKAVRAYAIEHGNNPKMRIVLAGHDDFDMPEGWRYHRWKAPGGYARLGKNNGRGMKNRSREMLWFSPHCAAHSAQADFLTELDEA